MLFRCNLEFDKNHAHLRQNVLINIFNATNAPVFILNDYATFIVITKKQQIIKLNQILFYVFIIESNYLSISSEFIDV